MMTNTPYAEPIWKSEGDEKRARVQSMFAQLASRYDLLNSLMCFRLHYRWRSIAAKKLALHPGDTVLDVCSGTGSFIDPLRKEVGPSGKVFGVDFCLPMLKVGHDRLAKKASFAVGDALALPFPSDSLDGLSVGWGIRNVVDIDAAHREIHRVLKSGKRFVSVDMAQPKNPTVRVVSQKLFVMVVPFLAGLFGKGGAYMYLPKSTEVFKSRDELAASMKGAGFQDVRWQDLMFGNVCVHWGLKV